MMYYNGISVDKVNFKKEVYNRIDAIEKQIEEIKTKLEKEKTGSYMYQYWTLKLDKAIKNLEVAEVTLD